ncbi:SDR family NAD(P)-dependent oxidoreductase, partial [Pseudophaeobacter sp.]|uniref:SDR family NAD(P)-dependent oxidoreductase n=1 Tax=Pseudophaeobacter sp. TaxID=1971739 RepID=UPI00329A7EBC
YGGTGLAPAAHLMRHYEAKVVLVSREGLPARADWPRYLDSHSPANRIAQRIRAVQELEEIGKGSLLPLAADVCNSAEMRTVLAQAEAEFGSLNGVIHGAGHIEDGPILAKSDEQIARVLAPKLTGLRVLHDLFPDGALDLMVLFSSSSTVTRPAGQIDYVAANEYLNAYAAHRRDDKTRVTAIDWGVWADTGMAAEAMAARQGTAAPSPRESCAQPLLETQGFDAFGNAIFASMLDAQQSWLLDEHRTKTGTALVPGTGYIEWVAEALTAQGFEAPFEISDLYFLRPLVVDPAAPREMVLRLTAQEAGYSFACHSALPEGGYALSCEAEVTLLPEVAVPPPLDLKTIQARCPAVKKAPAHGVLHSPQEAHLDFGPRWQVLKQAAFGSAEGLARLHLAKAAQQDNCLLHPGLMDLATGWAIALVPGYDGSDLWVPLGYHSLRVFAPLTLEICSHMRLAAGANAENARFDITLTDPEGRVLVEISGFQMTRLVAGFDATPSLDTADISAEALGLAASAAQQPLSEDERRLQINIANGIRAEEGPEALTRALATGRAQVVVSSLDLPALIEQTAQSVSGAGTEESQSFERPQLDTDYIAPSTPLEEQLAALFQSLLGVSQVGVADSFFDLGGHSLIAVRLFAQIKRQFDVDLPLATLFEAPSVASLATLLSQRGVGSTEDCADTGTTVIGDAPANYTHLVQLHAGADTGAPPFFVVAGMFGNVLNLRHLALELGGDRPVYGLQARGLIGGAEPHLTIEEAAQDYLAEIKQIQSQGPYLLGGFSGGGITAYEMAQQLQVMGEEVAALVLLDTPLPVRPSLTGIDKALIKLQELRRKGAGYLLEWAKNRILWEVTKRRQAPAETGTAPAFNNRKIELAFRQAVEAYALHPWKGPLTLLRPPLDQHWQVSGGKWVSQEREYVFADNDWSQWAPSLEVIEVPGDHDSMVLVPNVSSLAAALKPRLKLQPTATAPAEAGPIPQNSYARAAE